VNFLQSWFKRWARRLERHLFQTALIAVAVLIASQLIMINAGARYYLNRTEYLEGAPYRWAAEDGKPGVFMPEGEGVLEHVYWVELGLREGKGPLEVLRNGAAVGILESGNVIIYVNPGDILEIRGEITQDQPAVVEVISTRGLANPRVGTQVTTYGDYDLIGWAVPQNGE
jgi:hypothetical protein